MRRMCNARTRNGRCKRSPVAGRTRCYQHAGLSTGPRTPEGKARTIAALQRGRLQWLARLKAAGLKAPCGQKPGGGRVRSKDKTIARAQRIVEEKVMAKAKNLPADQPAALPAVPEKSWNQMSRGEKLASNSDLALDVTRKILELGVNPEDVRVLRVVKDTALVIISNSIKVDEGQMRTDEQDQRRALVLEELRRKLLEPSDTATDATPAKRGNLSDG